MNNKPNRVARITSSKISALTVAGKGEFGFGAGAITYLKDKKKELDYGRGIQMPVYTQAMTWGKCWEVWVHWQLGNEYKLIIDQTTVHPKYEIWAGSQDFDILENNIHIGISELKCYQMSNHYDYVKCLQKQCIETFKKEFKDEYWQIVSNSCIHDTKFGEAIAFLPTEENLLEMRQLLEHTNYVEANIKDNPSYYEFIWSKDLYDLPFIPSHSDFPSLVKFRFEIPLEDKILLTKLVINADKYLNQ